MNVLTYIKGLFAENPDASILENAKIRSFVLYLTISGILGTIASLTTIGQVDITNPVNFFIVIVMPMSLVLLAPMAWIFRSDKLCTVLFIYSFTILCCNTYVDANNGLDSTIFGLILVVVVSLYYSWIGMAISMIGFGLQNFAIPIINIRFNPETAALYDFHYYQYAFFDLITAFIVASCALVFRNGFISVTMELEQERHRSKMAERAKSEFLANMSHEIRTPMNGVVGMTALLANTPLNDQQKMFTDIITKSGNSLLTIINDILDFSKLDAGEMKLDLAPFNLQEAVEDVTALFSSEITKKNMDIIVRVSPNVPDPLIGDVGRIRQVVMNLVGNAVKFTENGHVYVNIECDERQKPSDMSVDGKEDTANLTISVTDTGIGIQQEKLAHIFNKFSQVDESATRKHEGTGLGLSISCQLVELMGGSIRVESKEGEGSCFTVEVALEIDNNQIQRSAPAQLLGSKVMIVETNPLVASIRNERFQSWGLDSASVSTGFECIECLYQMEAQGVLPDLIAMSCQLEDLEGLQVVAKIRENPKLAEIPILMLTNIADLEDNQEYSKLNIEANLLKPWYTTVLMETVLRLLDAKYSRQVEAKEGKTVPAKKELEAS